MKTKHLIVSFYYRYDLSLSGLVLVQPRKASPNMTWKIVNWDIKNENKTFNCFILLQIWPQLIGLSTGSTQEGQSQHDLKNDQLGHKEWKQNI